MTIEYKGAKINLTDDEKVEKKERKKHTEIGNKKLFEKNKKYLKKDIDKKKNVC